MKKLTPLEIIQDQVPGTSRQIVRASNGTELQRQNVYLKAEAWDALAELCKEQNVSGSVVIARLIWQASKHNPAYRNPTKTMYRKN